MTQRRAIEILMAARLPYPAVIPEDGGFAIYSGFRKLATGTTVQLAMMAAKEYWKDVVRLPIFQPDGLMVVRAGVVEATAKSKTMAMRIANALNQYNPGERAT